MARRQRVPRHKEHRRKRNKNPKLSPFQREQQRAKLANQPPITSIKGSQRDFPISQRGVIQYLMEKRERQMEKKRLREEAAAAAEKIEKEEKEKQKEEQNKVEFTENDVESNTALDTDNVSCGSSLASDLPLQGEEEEEEVPMKKKKKKGSLIKKKKSQEDEINTNESSSSSLVSSSVSKKSKKDRTLQSKTKKTPTTTTEIVALNDQFAATLAPPIAAFRTQTDSSMTGVGQQENSSQVIIARKKEKKHRKKVEARRERVRQMLLETEKQLQDQLLLTKTGKKRKRGESVDAKDAAFERKLIQMQKEKAAKEALEKREAAKAKQKEEENGTSSKRANRRKQISFTDNNEDNGEDAPHRAMRYPNDKGKRKASEFYELVDVVRYGERVEAPPVFDAVPRHDASITRLAQRLEYTTKSTNNRKGSTNNNNNNNNTMISTASGSSSKADRLKLLSSVGGIGEQKRLERLGLVPVGAGGGNTIGMNSNMTIRSVQLSKEEEMRRLREGVMEAYRRNRRAEVVSRKGVDMQHQFPLFS